MLVNVFWECIMFQTININKLNLTAADITEKAPKKILEDIAYLNAGLVMSTFSNNIFQNL